MFNTKNYLKNFDIFIPIILLLITLMGAFSIGISMLPPTDGQSQTILELISSFNIRHVNLHMLWFLFGAIALAVVVFIDYRNYSVMSPYMYWAIVAALIYVDLRGVVAGGAQSWIDFGAFRFQPSEFAKITVIIVLAKLLSSKPEGINRFLDLIPLGIATGIPLIMIILQPDFGTAAVIFAIFFGMLFMGGLSYKLIALLVALSASGFTLMCFTFLTEIQKARILVFLNPGADPMGSGYHVMKSIVALASGRVFGKDLFDGNTLSQLDFLPAKHTDFIFSVMTEGLGFVAGAAIIILYLLLIARTLLIAATSRDRFGSMLVAGVASMMMVHIFVNIGMTMGIVPVTGIPLPFLSYGGSSMLANMVAYGLVLNVGMRRQETFFSAS